MELKNAAADNQKKIELKKDQISTLKNMLSTKINTQLLNVPGDKVSQAQILPRTRTYAYLKKLPDLDLGLESETTNEIRPQSVSDTVEIEDNDDENNFEDKKDETFPSSSPIVSVSLCSSSPSRKSASSSLFRPDSITASGRNPFLPHLGLLVRNPPVL